MWDRQGHTDAYDTQTNHKPRPSTHLGTYVYLSEAEVCGCEVVIDNATHTLFNVY